MCVCVFCFFFSGPGNRTLLDVIGNYWKLLEILGNSWKFLEILGDSWKFVDIRGNSLKSLEIAGPGNGYFFSLQGQVMAII